VQLLRDTDTPPVVSGRQAGRQRGVEGGLNGRWRPWSGSREGWRVTDGRMDRRMDGGGDDERGEVGRTGGGEDDGMDGVAVGAERRCGEGGRETQLVEARRGERREQGVYRNKPVKFKTF